MICNIPSSPNLSVILWFSAMQSSSDTTIMWCRLFPCMPSPNPLALLSLASAWAVYVAKDLAVMKKSLSLVFFSSCKTDELSYGNTFSTTFWNICRPWCTELSLRSFHVLFPTEHLHSGRNAMKNRRQTKVHPAALDPRAPSVWVVKNTQAFVDLGFCLVAGGTHSTLWHVTVLRSTWF